MNQQACVYFAGRYGIENFVEWDCYGLDAWLEELQREITRGALAGDGNAPAFQVIFLERVSRNYDRAVTFAETCAAI